MDNGKLWERGEKSRREYTVTYQVEVTKVFKGDVADEGFLANEYGEIVRERIKNIIDSDDVKLKRLKVFPRDGE